MTQRSRRAAGSFLRAGNRFNGWLGSVRPVMADHSTALMVMLDKDPEKRNRVMKAMLQMSKIDIEGLKRAYDAAS
jgi:hypothetical protein